MMLSEFGSFDFLPPARLNLLPKLKYTAIFMKTEIVNNLMTLLLIMKMKFRNFNFLHQTGAKLLLEMCL